MENNTNIEIDKNVYRIIKMGVIAKERKNAKSHEKSDTEMINDIKGIIVEEVDRAQK